MTSARAESHLQLEPEEEEEEELWHRQRAESGTLEWELEDNNGEE